MEVDKKFLEEVLQAMSDVSFFAKTDMKMRRPDFQRFAEVCEKVRDKIYQAQKEEVAILATD